MMTFAAPLDGPRDLDSAGRSGEPADPWSGGPRPVLPTDGGNDTDTGNDNDTGGTRQSHLGRAFRYWLSGWWALVMLVSGLLTGVAALTLVALAISGVFSLPAALTGVLLLIPALWGAWGLGRAERHRLIAFTGVDIGPSPESRDAAWRRYLGVDQPRLLALAWAALHTLWGFFSSLTAIVVTSHLVALAALPLYVGSISDQGLRILPFVRVSSDSGYALTWVLAVSLLLLLPLVARAATTVDVTLGRWLLGVDPSRQLEAMTERVHTLTTTREEALDSVEAERRRIERDLHDGPQQRLVSIAMSLGMARDALDRDPELVRQLLDEAHASSKEAIIEMRQVARGIVPPILTDRGLDAAVSALAARSPVPVTVTSRLTGRLDPTVEAIAYFCVSESLTNVAKHSGATNAVIEMGLARDLSGDVLTVTVSDDGRGGAKVGAGSGLTGLRQRVASVDGQLRVQSAEGAGTSVAITLPLRHQGAR